LTCLATLPLSPYLYTGIFEPDIFQLYLESRTHVDGADLGPHLARFFAILNTPAERRQTNLDEDLAALPYVNGNLFSEHLGFAEFNAEMRHALLACCMFKWSRISPHIFDARICVRYLPASPPAYSLWPAA
jgi:hypothetical protein